MSEVKKITITRAMKELKLLKDRIDKKISQVHLVGLYQNKSDIMVQENIGKEEFEKRAKADYQSIVDLIEYRKVIKSKIMLSNANTYIEVCGKKYTVTEAIARKVSIEFEQNLLKQMRHQYNAAVTAVEKQKPALDESVEEMLKQNLGKEAKPTEEDYKTISDPFLNANKLNIIDPCNVSEAITKLDDDIDTFMAEVDLVLSESNAKTEIEVGA